MPQMCRESKNSRVCQCRYQRCQHNKMQKGLPMARLRFRMIVVSGLRCASWLSLYELFQITLPNPWHIHLLLFCPTSYYMSFLLQTQGTNKPHKKGRISAEERDKYLQQSTKLFKANEEEVNGEAINIIEINWELERIRTGLSIKLSGLAVRIVHGSQKNT